MTAIAKFQIGKNGLTENFIEAINLAFKTRKQIRISILKTATRNKEEIEEIAKAIQGKLPFKTTSRIIGFTIILIKFPKRNKFIFDDLFIIII